MIKNITDLLILGFVTAVAAFLADLLLIFALRSIQ
jgi:hypothetical protein